MTQNNWEKGLTYKLTWNWSGITSLKDHFTLSKINKMLISWKHYSPVLKLSGLTCSMTLLMATKQSYAPYNSPHWKKIILLTWCHVLLKVDKTDTYHSYKNLNNNSSYISVMIKQSPNSCMGLIMTCTFLKVVSIAVLLTFLIQVGLILISEESKMVKISYLKTYYKVPKSHPKRRLYQ